MKRLIAILICACMIITGCGTKETGEKQLQKANKKQSESVPKFSGMNDPKLLSYVKNNVYQDLIENLDNKKYFIENVQTVYVSKEYIDELAYNSNENIYFGYTLSQLEKQFQGKPYIFTLGEDGKTTVKEFEPYDDFAERVIKNVVIGTGVILVCVTVSAVTAGAGAPAVSMVFAVAAKSGTVMAVSSAAISGTVAGTIEAVETKGDVEKSLKEAAVSASEGFKMGAIMGTISGGISQASLLKGATLNGLTMNEAAAIQKESKWSLETIKEIKSMDEYKIYRSQGLYEQEINGKISLVKKIDLDTKIKSADGTRLTNRERIANNLSPIDPVSKEPYELHHVNQEEDGVLAILPQGVHRNNAGILNKSGKVGVHNEKTGISDSQWNKLKNNYWKGYSEANK